ncbi:MAG TPA: TetR/AcrR family transcriptional regulator [Mucilaginibacter sp.]|nr:TetR/AcrR family transcriptional regulator [Mucilaginibacter sp.]
MTAVKTDDMVQEEILRAGIRLYRKFGPNKVTMDEVAHATGRSRTSLYYYYKNRDEIFQAVLDTIVDDIVKEMKRAISAAEGVKEKIRAFCLSKIKTSENWRKVLQEMWASMNAEEKTKHTRAMSTLHTKLVYNEGIIVKEILAEAIGNKEIRAIGPAEQDMLAFVLSSCVRGLRNEFFDRNDPHDVKSAFDLLTGMIAKWITD